MKWVNIEKKEFHSPGSLMRKDTVKYEYGFYIEKKHNVLNHDTIECPYCKNILCTACELSKKESEKKWVNFVDYIKDKVLIQVLMKDALSYYFYIGKKGDSWRSHIPKNPKINLYGIEFVVAESPGIIELDGCKLGIEEDD